VIPRKDLADVIEARAEETLSLIANDIRMSGVMPMLGAGIVLTGGASQLDGIVELGEYIFDIPVRRGVPIHVGGLTDVVKSGEFSTAVGLLMYGLTQRKDLLNQNHNVNEIKIGDSIHGMTRRLKEIFETIF
jgi:cell division protein FtsA